MRQLVPVPIDDVDPAEVYGADERAPHDGRPWVLVNMIATVDGATALDGVSGPLGGPADKAVFRAIRGVADTILVGAGTVRAENYGPARARIAVATRSGNLDPGARLFREADPTRPRPIVITCEACPAERRAALAEVAEIVVAGAGTVDLAVALAALAERGARVVVCEGGPSLNGELLAAGLIDEWCQTFAPLLAGGRSPRAIAGDAPSAPRRLRLDRLLEEDGYCFCRYVRLDSSVISAVKSERSSNPL